jgi:hypothetical protein
MTSIDEPEHTVTITFDPPGPIPVTEVDGSKMTAICSCKKEQGFDITQILGLQGPLRIFQNEPNVAVLTCPTPGEFTLKAVDAEGHSGTGSIKFF